MVGCDARDSGMGLKKMKPGGRGSGGGIKYEEGVNIKHRLPLYIFSSPQTI